MSRWEKLISALALASLLLAVLLFKLAPATNRRAETIIWAEPRLDNVYVYGEQAHFALLPGFGQDVLLLKGGERLYCRPSELVNQGLYLPRLTSGLYRLYAGDLCILAPDDFELDGYTITRQSQNLHYRFFSEQGRLVLRVATVASLPETVFDVLIDAGHGGSNTGAIARGYVEKDENLRSSLYLAQLLRAAGLKVAVTRDGDYIPGQPGVAEADIDPYITGGRVDLAYQTQAKYFISNHLNASARAAFQGWQLFRSVQAGDAWQQAVSAALLAYGHQPSDDYHTLGSSGIYRRYSQDNPQTGNDYYYILRETGGELTKPRRFAQAHPWLDLRRGAEGLLVEYLFLDNYSDMEYWAENWQGLVEAVVTGCLDYWGIK